MIKDAEEKVFLAMLVESLQRGCEIKEIAEELLRTAKFRDNLSLKRAAGLFSAAIGHLEEFIGSQATLVEKGFLPESLPDPELQADQAPHP
jgi:hypothetical protein